MALIKLNRFGGRAPRISPTLLAEHQSQVARNCRLWAGDLRSWRRPVEMVQPANQAELLSIFFHRPSNTWLAWEEPVDVVRNPLWPSGNGRIYYTGTDAPRATDTDLLAGTQDGEAPAASYRLGMPAPGTAPNVSTDGGGGGNPVATTYVYTFVSGWGEEGPPSPPSDVIDVEDNDTVTVSNMDGAPTGDFNITHRRIYRRASGVQGGAWLFVAEIEIFVSSHDDSLEDSELGEILPSEEWQMPPDDLEGLIALPNGILAGFRENELLFSDPYVPYGWPERYRQSIDFPIVALGNFGTTLVIATEGHPYLATASDPANMTLSKISALQPCLSKQSLVSTETGVLYASPNGLYQIGPQGHGLVTRWIMTRNEWQDLYRPHTIKAAVHDGRYFGWYDTGRFDGVMQGAMFMLDPNDEDVPLVDANVHAFAAHVDPEDDELYFMRITDEIERIERWEGRIQRFAFTWRSRRFVTRNHLNLSAALLIADFGITMTEDEREELIADNQARLDAEDETIGGPINGHAINGNAINGDDLLAVPAAEGSEGIVLRLIGDGQQRAQITINNSRPYRLPLGYRAKEWEVELAGRGTVHEVRLATSVRELTAQ